MSKEIDLIKNIIKEVDDNLYSVYGNAPQLLITDKLRDLLFRLDTPEVRDFFENYNQQDKIEFAIAELEKVEETMFKDAGRDVYDIILCQIKQLKEKN